MFSTCYCKSKTIKKEQNNYIHIQTIYKPNIKTKIATKILYCTNIDFK